MMRRMLVSRTGAWANGDERGDLPSLETSGVSSTDQGCRSDTAEDSPSKLYLQVHGSQAAALLELQHLGHDCDVKESCCMSAVVVICTLIL
jgi:hypothetical protein